MERRTIEKTGKNVVLGLLFLFLCIPMIQNVTHFKKWEKPLDGSFYPESDALLNWEEWFAGDFAVQKDKYIKENFGFRSYYVRLICQFNFSLFRTTGVTNMVIGKNNYLYEVAYLDAYYGRDFIGKEKIDAYVGKLKKIQDTLEKQHKLIFLVLAPGKACFYPEYIPDNYKSEPKLTNYAYFKTSAVTHKFNHIDFYKFFIDQKNKSKYPLYPQLGIHWSDYGAVMAFDSIVRYAENKMNLDLPDISITQIAYEDSLRSVDNDAVKSLNLYKNPATFKMAYPGWKVNYDTTKHKKPNLLVISDSFWWYIYGTGLPGEIFSPARFWYYNKEIYPESFNSPIYVTGVDYATRIKQADVILLMHSEATLRKFGGGFVDMCYDTYYNPNTRNQKIQEIKEKIRSSPKWLEDVAEKAKKKYLPLDSMLTLDAIFLLEEEKK